MEDLYLQKFGLDLKKYLKNESGWDMICKEMQDPYPKMEERICTMKKFLSLLMAVMMMATVLAGCGSSSSSSSSSGSADSSSQTEAQEPAASEGGAELTFGTGGDQGTYYGYGSVLAQAITNDTATKVTAVVSGGSKDNIEMMDMEEYQMGFVQSDVMSYAYEGTNLFEGAAIDNFSTVAALYMEQVQIVTCDPTIKTVADLKGKNVSVGSSGSGVYFNALDVLGAYDLTLDDITPTYQSFGDSVDALTDGKIDAAFVVAGAPTVAVTSLATSKDVYLVSLDKEHIDALRETSPYYSEYTIGKDVYGTDEDCTTVAVGAVIIARDDVAEADVYNVVSTIFDKADSLAHDKAKDLDLEFATSITNIPYHPGAAKYFSEQGVTVPTK